MDVSSDPLHGEFLCFVLNLLCLFVCTCTCSFSLSSNRQLRKLRGGKKDENEV